MQFHCSFGLDASTPTVCYSKKEAPQRQLFFLKEIFGQTYHHFITNDNARLRLLKGFYINMYPKDFLAFYSLKHW
jgi:hypothetical protein